MSEHKDVSYRHMTWWPGGSGWTVDHTGGQQEAADERGVQPPEPREERVRQERPTGSLGEADRERQERWRRKESNTIHIVVHQPTTTAITVAATTATAQQRQHHQSAEHDHEGADEVQLGPQRERIPASASRDSRSVAQ